MRNYLITIGLVITGMLACNLPGQVADNTSIEPISLNSPDPTAEPTAMVEVEGEEPIIAEDATGGQPATSSVIPTEGLPEISLDVELMYEERWMRVSESVSLVNDTGDTWEEVVFNVPVNVQEGAFSLDRTEVTINGSDPVEVSTFIPAEETIFRVELPEPASPRDSIQVDMRFRVVVQPVASTSWPPVGTTGWTADLIQAGEWYPALVPYIEGEGWHTWEYHPVGDPTFYPAVNASLTVLTDPWVRVASGGPQTIEETDDGKVLWSYQVDGARGVAFFASDSYEVLEGEAAGIPVYSYFLPQHSEAGEEALKITVESIELFTELFGPFPYDSLTLAENGFFGGMEYSGVISVTDYAYATYQGQPNSILHALVSHETAHQWWYGAVGNDQANEPWLDESLSFFSELLYFEHYYPEHEEWWWYTRVTRFETYGPVDATIYNYDDSSNFIISVYGQSAYFIRDLRNVMGNDDFYAFLQDYYLTYAGKIATSEDFIDMARSHTDTNLDPLIQVYFRDKDL